MQAGEAYLYFQPIPLVVGILRTEAMDGNGGGKGTNNLSLSFLH